MAFLDILMNLPEVQEPAEKKLSFNAKLKWTLIIIVCFFILANIPLYGLGKNALARFEYLAVILGTDFGSLISLGIGPIVMASIVLQLLVGSGILSIDLTNPEGKKYFQGLQKLFTLGFILFEACIYVFMKGLEALPGFELILIVQLCMGGLLIVFMDEVVSKWGFGSGVSLFILAGVGWRLFSGAFGFINPQGMIEPSGKVVVFITSLMAGDLVGMGRAISVIIATIIVFLIVVWAQSLKVEIPLTFDRIRGYGVRWPLSFFYASVIPVILTVALLSNLQLFASLLQNWMGHPTILGSFTNGQATSGIIYWISAPHPNLVEGLITKSFRVVNILQAIFHTLFYVVFSIIFAVFWVKTSGMDASTQAKNILNSGLQIPGFRKDERILEAVLSRYIMPLTIMGGAAIGLLSSITDLIGALTSGTSILLSVMITYQLYQEIAKQHTMDMHPALKKIIGS